MVSHLQKYCLQYSGGEVRILLGQNLYIGVHANRIFLTVNKRDGRKDPTMYCKQCGAQINDNAKFCGVCGTPTVSAEQTPEAVTQNSRHTFYAPESIKIDTIEFITSYITFYLKGSVEFTNDNVIAQVPNTILGVIPLGRRKRTLDVAHITSTVSNFRVDIKNLLIGAVIALFGLGELGDPNGLVVGLVALVFGVLMVLNALISYVAISLDSGEVVIIPLVIFERSKSDMIADNINKLLSARKYDTNVRIHAENAADRVVYGQEQIVTAINGLK